MQDFREIMKTRLWIGLATAALLLVLVVFSCLHAAAAGNTPPGPDRFTVIVEKYASYEWWLTNWADNTVICIIDIDHDGLPPGGDIFNVCGQDIYDVWIVSQPCPKGGSCQGYYLQFVKSFPAQRKVSVKQPPPVVWVTLKGCVPYQSTFRCDSLPNLVLTGEEPLQGEHITGLAGNMDGKPFPCDPVCQVDLAPTDENGSTIEFWAYSSYGESSDVFQAQVRVAKSVDTPDKSWYTDVLSSQ